jgi:predicted acyl esterase
VTRRHADDPEAAATAVGELIAAADGLPHPTLDELPTGAPSQHDPFLVRLGVPIFDVEAADVSRHQPSVEVPVLNVGGWFDVFLQGTIDNFVNGGERDRLVIGPWNHMSFLPQQGELNFGCAAGAAAVELGPSLNTLTFAWLRARLADEAEEDDGRVRIFTMGANRWRTEPAGPLDQSNIEGRDDVLVLTTEPLSMDLEVTGRVTATLQVSTDAPTTDWVVRLCDVHPDSASYNVCDGITRVMSVPGEPHAVEVDLWSTSMLFASGHRIRVHVTSSSFPRWDRNLNTSDGFETGQMRVANQTVHLGPGSFITLPVIPLGGEAAT